MPESHAHGLPLLDAISQYSDQDTWDKFERSLGLTPPKDRVAWTNDDRATYIFQINLKLRAIQTRLSLSHLDVFLDQLKTRNLWARLKNRFRSRLQSGELLATGYVEPVDIGAERISIPPDKWHFLELDFRDSRAEYGRLKLVNVRVSEGKPTASIVKAAVECREWLRNESDQIFNTVKPFNKQNVFDDAKRRFEGLSRRSFNYEWAMYAPESWRRPGKKPEK